MSFALMLAAFLSPSPAAPAPLTRPAADRSMSDSDRLRELDIAVRQAYARREIDSPTAQEIRLGIARVRRQMVIMGIQVGYRQRLRLRARIDRLYARLAERGARGPADIRSEK